MHVYMGTYINMHQSLLIICAKSSYPSQKPDLVARHRILEKLYSIILRDVQNTPAPQLELFEVNILF